MVPVANRTSPRKRGAVPTATAATKVSRKSTQKKARTTPPDSEPNGEALSVTDTPDSVESVGQPAAQSTPLMIPVSGATDATTTIPPPFHYPPAFGNYAQQLPYGHQPLYAHAPPYAGSNGYGNGGNQTAPYIAPGHYAHYMAQYQAFVAQQRMIPPSAPTPTPTTTGTTTPTTTPTTTSSAVSSAVDTLNHAPPAFNVDFGLLLKEPSAPSDKSNGSEPTPEDPSAPAADVLASTVTATAISPPIDPNLVPPPSTPVNSQITLPESQENQKDGVDSDSDDEYEEISDGVVAPKRTDIKGRHVSSSNNFYGDVDGVGRGISDWVVARTLKMGPAFTEQRDATRAHNAMLRTLISRAEHLSTRTGSWLYIAAQHPGSNNSFIHFASPKLRKFPEELDKLHSQAGRTMGALLDSTRKEVTKLSATVMEKDQEIKGLEQKLRDAEASLAVRETDIAMLGRALNLVRSGDPRTLALLAEINANTAQST